jgi:hypothetical protein
MVYARWWRLQHLLLLAHCYAIACANAWVLACLLACLLACTLHIQSDFLNTFFSVPFVLTMAKETIAAYFFA